MKFVAEHTDVYEYLKTCGKPVAIYGMGNGADKLFNIFADKGIEVAEVFASDDFVRGHSFRGYKVKKYAEVAEKYGSFVIVPAFATRLPEIMARMDKMDAEQEVRFPELPVFGEEPMDTDFFEQHKHKIEAAYELMDDEISGKVYASLINFRISGKLEYLQGIMSDRDEIFAKIGITDKEVYADLGAYDGDTIRELTELAGGFSRAIAIEPDRRNFRKLTAFAEGRQDITLVNKAVSNKPCVLRFNDKAGRNSAFDEQGRAEVQADAPDNIFEEYGFNDVSYVKFDVEGAEADALRGMERTLKEAKPKLCVCAYHRSCDLWELALLIHELNPDYKLAVRKHLYYPGWETALYCY